MADPPDSRCAPLTYPQSPSLWHILPFPSLVHNQHLLVQQMMSVFEFFDRELAPALSEAMVATVRSGAVGAAAAERLGHCLLELS